MQNGQINAKEVFLGEQFGKAIVHAGDVTIEITDTGDVTVHTNGIVGTQPGPQRTPGDIQPDRTIYVGISPDTHRPFYVQPRDMPHPMSWNRSMDGAQIFEAYQHNDWREPTKGELSMMYKIAAKLGLDKDDQWHWASDVNPKNDDTAWVERINCTGQYVWKGLTLATRYVRG